MVVVTRTGEVVSPKRHGIAIIDSLGRDRARATVATIIYIIIIGREMRVESDCAGSGESGNGLAEAIV